ncbi:uncharacterized protein LOC117194132 isoform X1 [Drosophila miranda]|uniref:uncharacterized protein LOC117194132 isoform X1 n=1 Tax=Drosophila miranda TaxID=7229 RepID=UPI00143F6105|nr:uncharacterized protein LOC117194132 isoform X1 [Drosophila miranda]
MIRLKWCCYCIALRKACIIIACLDFVINLTIATIGAKYHFIDRIEQAVAICHSRGCVFLIGGALLKSSVLLIFFLITSLTNYVILIAYIIYICFDWVPKGQFILPTIIYYIYTCGFPLFSSTCSCSHTSCFPVVGIYFGSSSSPIIKT